MLSLNGDGRLESIANPAGNTTHLTYAADLLSILTDPGGGLHHYTYDALGRLTAVQSPDGEVQSITHTDLAAACRSA